MKAFIIPSYFTAVDKFSGVLKGMGKNVDQFASRAERALQKVSDKAMSISRTSLIVGSAIMAPIALMANEAVKFEDKLADVAKTTQLEGKALESYGNSVLKLSKSTRTSIDDLLTIGEIGGQLGIAQNELVGFTDAMNKFNVALGKDFQGGIEEAASQVGKIRTLFKETRDLDVATAINKIGSGINVLGAKGSATSANMTDFILRIGALPDAIKPTIQQTQALAAVFEESGITSEIAARGFGDVLLTASKNSAAFGKQMSITALEAKQLINSNPAEFVAKFAKSLRGLDAEQLSRVLKQLGIGDTGAIKVIGSLSTQTERYTELLGFANEAIAKGTSLTDEYNTKNNTTAARLAQAKNNFQALSITLGAKLLPILNKILEKIIPVIDSVVDWVRENPKLSKTIMVLVAGVGGLLLLLSAFTGVIGIITGAMAAWKVVTTLMTISQLGLNMAFLANPITWIVIGIAALIALLYVVIKKYDEWGASLTFILGPLGLIINLVMSLARNWDYIKESFSKGGILKGLLAIGATLLDAVLYPLEQILKIAAKLTGWDWVEGISSDMSKLRSFIGTAQNDPMVNEKPAVDAVNPDASRQEFITESIKTVQNNIGIDINDKTGRANVSKNTGIPVNLTTTMAY